MNDEPIIIKVITEGGEEASLQLSRVSDHIGGVEKKAKSAERQLSMFSRGFGKLTSGLSMALGAAGFAGLTFGLGEAINKAREFQEISAQLGQAVRAAGLSVKPSVHEFQEFADTLAMHGGFAPPQTLQGLTQLVRVTHSVEKAQSAMTLATNIARGSHASLTQATRAVMMAEAGRLTGLTRLGIILPKHSTATQALAILQQRYAGATTAYSKTSAGAMSNLTNMLDIIGEKVGGMLIPILGKAANGVMVFVTQIQHGTGAGGVIRNVFIQLWDVLKTGVSVLVSVGKWFVGLYNDFQHGHAVVVMLVGALAGLGVALLAYRGYTLAVAAGTAAWTTAQGILNAVMLMNPIGIVVLAVAAFIGALIAAYTKVKWFHDGVNAIWHAIESFFSGVGHGIASTFDSIVNGVISAINWVIRAIDSIHVKIPSWIPVIGGKSIGFHLSQIAYVGGDSGGGHGGASSGIKHGHFALGGYVYGQGHQDDVMSYLKPGEYVVPEKVVKAAGGRAAMDEWRGGGGMPGGSLDDLMRAIQQAMAGMAVEMDGRPVGQVLVRQGRQQKALR